MSHSLFRVNTFVTKSDKKMPRVTTKIDLVSNKQRFMRVESPCGQGVTTKSQSGTPASSCTPKLFNAIDTKLYCPTVNTKSIICC